MNLYSYFFYFSIWVAANFSKILIFFFSSFLAFSPKLVEAEFLRISLSPALLSFLSMSTISCFQRLNFALEVQTNHSYFSSSLFSPPLLFLFFILSLSLSFSALTNHFSFYQTLKNGFSNDRILHIHV